MGVNLNINPFEWIDNTAKDQATASRDLSSVQFNEQMDFSRDQWEYAKRQNIIDRTKEDSKVQRLVKDAEKAGISPLAAMGIQGSGPMSVNFPQIPSGQAGGTYVGEPKGTSIGLELGGKDKRRSLIAPDMTHEEYMQWQQEQQARNASDISWFQAQTDQYNWAKRGYEHSKYGYSDVVPLYKFYNPNLGDRPPGTIAMPNQEFAEGGEGKWGGRFGAVGVYGSGIEEIKQGTNFLDWRP